MGQEKIPKLDDESDYEVWKKKVLIWQSCTSTPLKQQAGKLIMNMSGKAEEVAIHLNTERLASETNGSTGVEYLISELDKIIEKDSTQEFYSRVKSFMRFYRPETMNINSYISEFEHRHRALLQLRPTKKLFDDDILAAMLLDQGNFTKEDQKLLRSTVNDLTYDKMVAQLKRTFSSNSTEDNSSGSSSSVKSYTYSPSPSPTIKEESCFFQGDVEYNGHGNCPEQCFLQNGCPDQEQSCYNEASGDFS